MRNVCFGLLKEILSPFASHTEEVSILFSLTNARLDIEQLDDVVIRPESSRRNVDTSKCRLLRIHKSRAASTPDFLASDCAHDRSPTLQTFITRLPLEVQPNDVSSWGIREARWLVSASNVNRRDRKRDNDWRRTRGRRRVPLRGRGRLALLWTLRF